MGVIEVYISNTSGEKVDRIDENLLYILEPNLEDNLYIYKTLYHKNWEYISHADFNNITCLNSKYVNILNIGKKYKLYVLLKNSTDREKLKYIATYISSTIADEIVVNKVSNINEGIKTLDIVLNMGKEVYSIPGNIFDYKSYMANFAIKNGATPICGLYDIDYILLQKHYKSI